MHSNMHTDGPGGFGSSYYGGPGYGENGPGLNGVYYDWYSGYHRSTSDGSYVPWQYAYNIASQYASERWWRETRDAYAGMAGSEVYKGTVAYGTWKNSSVFQVAANEGGNSLYMVGMGLNAAGFAAGAGEYSNVVNGMWRGANSKWYSTSWGGNQWTGARSTVMSRAGAFKLAGRWTFGAGTVIGQPLKSQFKLKFSV